MCAQGRLSVTKSWNVGLTEDMWKTHFRQEEIMRLDLIANDIANADSDLAALERPQRVRLAYCYESWAFAHHCYSEFADAKSRYDELISLRAVYPYDHNWTWTIPLTELRNVADKHRLPPTGRPWFPEEPAVEAGPGAADAADEAVMPVAPAAAAPAAAAPAPARKRARPPENAMDMESILQRLSGNNAHKMTDSELDSLAEE